MVFGKALKIISDNESKVATLMIGEKALLELKQAIKHNNLMMSGLLVAKNFQPELNIARTMEQMESFIVDANKHVEKQPDLTKTFHQFVSYFYKTLAFSGDDRDYFASKYNLMNQVMDFRTGIPVSLAMIFCQVGNALGLKLQGINFPGHYLVRFQAAPDRFLYMDPLDGSLLDWATLQNLYFSILGEQAEEEMPVEALEPVGCEETIIRLLHNLKSSFINEGQYQFALATVDILVHLCPEDPYERRDRGFLLHQLECPQVAMADYEYFIKHCPKDPSAPLLKIQLKQLQRHTVVLH